MPWIIKIGRCTFVDNAPSTNPWCSTKTESNNDHIGGGGFYGDCLSGACPVLSDDTEFEDWKDKNTLGWWFFILKCLDNKWAVRLHFNTLKFCYFKSRGWFTLHCSLVS